MEKRASAVDRIVASSRSAGSCCQRRRVSQWGAIGEHLTHGEFCGLWPVAVKQAALARAERTSISTSSQGGTGQQLHLLQFEFRCTCLLKFECRCSDSDTESDTK